MTKGKNPSKYIYKGFRWDYSFNVSDVFVHVTVKLSFNMRLFLLNEHADADYFGFLCYSSY